MPGPGTAVARRIAELKLHEFALANGAVLETGCVYIVPLIESLALPADIAASTNPKSSTGRLDVFTRVIADETRGFDRVEPGLSRSALCRDQPEDFSGAGARRVAAVANSLSPRRCGAQCRDLARIARARAAGRPRRGGDGRWRCGERRSFRRTTSCQAEGKGACVGYRAKRHTAVIEVERRAAYDVADFWEPITARADRSLILDPDEFYILASTEAVQVPPDYAAEMVPFDPLVGEFRVHYAGFFDPGFGYAGAGGLGARAVLEVRSREVPFILEHGQIVGRLVYENMLARPDRLYGSGIGSNYQAQGLKLSKHFRG